MSIISPRDAATPPPDSPADAAEADSEAIRLRRRRRQLALFASGCMAILVAMLATVMLAHGLTVIEVAMLALFALNLPWIVLGLCNAVIGFRLLRLCADPLARILPLARPGHPEALASVRVALVMPVHDEDPAAVFRSLRTTVASLDATGRGDNFDVFVLSDSRDDAVAAHEQALFAAWQADDRQPDDRQPARLHYRRRADNAGFKSGNLRDFCDRWGGDYDHMIVLDADSVMTGAAILRLVALMTANPRLGILQTLIAGLPSESAFARIFQYGMRHGMRAYSMGAAWWQGDAGPYWGHNAIIRLRPFIDHCRLPEVPGGGPLGGIVLSHDQIEAVLMRKAGYAVRVLPVEDGSFEANPPTLLDFAKRDLRWCLGNMQYLRLLGLAGEHRLGRLQMLLAILMYTAAPCWLGFVVLGLAQLLLQTAGLPAGVLLAEPAWLPDPATLQTLGLALFVTVVGMTFAPKLSGLAQVLSDPAERRRYGGGARVLGSAALEFVFSCLLAPVVSMAQTIFLGGLLAGRRLTWRAQKRAGRSIRWRQAATRLWPQTLFGAVIGLTLALTAPGVLPWAAPLIVGLLLAIPFAVLTASPALGRRLAAAGWCATPEELAPPPEVRAVCAFIPATPVAGAGAGTGAGNGPAMVGRRPLADAAAVD